MGGFIKVDAERLETTALNTKVSKELFDDFKVYLKTQGYQINIILETFMQQYANGRFNINTNEINKWNRIKEDKATLNTTFNKEIYAKFKKACEENGCQINSTLMAFMEIYAKGTLAMEFVELKEAFKED